MAMEYTVHVRPSVEVPGYEDRLVPVSERARRACQEAVVLGMASTSGSRHLTSRAGAAFARHLREAIAHAKSWKPTRTRFSRVEPPAAPPWPFSALAEKRYEADLERLLGVGRGLWVDAFKLVEENR